MYLNTTFRIYPKKNEEIILQRLIDNYEFEINAIIKRFIEAKKVMPIPFKDINNTVPWNSKIEIIKQAKADYLKIIKRENNLKLFSYNYCKWTDVNFKYLGNQRIVIETFRKGVMLLDVYCNEFALDKINNQKIISLKIFKRKNKWLGTVSYYIQEKFTSYSDIMAIDLGVLVPAVVVTSKGKVRFFGNGRKKRYIQTKQKSIYDKIASNSGGKEIHQYNSWTNKLKDIDHKISKSIVDFAKENEVGLIKMENLGRIQKRNRHSRKISTWSYHRLMHYIIYKAKKEGIKVVLINPYNTSRKCPNCSLINIANDRHYECSCGYKNHRDIVGAVNILNSPYSHKTSL